MKFSNWVLDNEVDNTPISAARTGKWIEVRLAQQVLIAWQNNRVVMRYAISSGVRRTPTHRGTFHVYAKYRSARFRAYGYDIPNVPWVLFYSADYAIHGAYWHNNFGHPMSHGCVNLSVAAARVVYFWAPIGTTVIIH
jgi:lipoprotein-anchoring transpeptidase ErfK/SrfK